MKATTKEKIFEELEKCSFDEIRQMIMKWKWAGLSFKEDSEFANYLIKRIETELTIEWNEKEQQLLDTQLKHALDRYRENTFQAILLLKLGARVSETETNTSFVIKEILGVYGYGVSVNWNLLIFLKKKGFSAAQIAQEGLRTFTLVGHGGKDRGETINQLFSLGVDPFAAAGTTSESTLAEVGRFFSAKVIQLIVNHPHMATRRQEAIKEILSECYRTENWKVLASLHEKEISLHETPQEMIARLRHAVFFNRIEAIRCLLDWGVDPFIEIELTGVSSKCNIISYAALIGNREGIELILNHPSMATRTSDEEKTLLKKLQYRLAEITCEELLKNNNLDIALESANAIEDNEYKTYALRRVTKAFIEINNIDKAIAVAHFLPDATEKEKTLEYLLKLKKNQT